MEWGEEKRGGGDQALGEPEAPGGAAGPPPPVCAGTRPAYRQGLGLWVAVNLLKVGLRRGFWNSICGEICQ